MRAGIGPDLERAEEHVRERGATLGLPLHLLATTTSTNDEAKRAAKAGAPHGATWVTEEQTAGRGRQNRTWTSARGESLLFSTLARLSCPPSRLPTLAIAAGLAVQQAIARAASDSAPAMKWPNDVLVGGRKIAGVLVEAVTLGSRVDAVVIGIGINVHTRSFPEEIADRATSVALVARDVPERQVLLSDVLAQLDRDVHVVAARGLGLLRARLDAADALRNARVRSEAGEAGVASGIDDDGRLVVRRNDGVVVRWSAGEVHVVGTARVNT
jgi:BirA family biotin operon repressor/biotin-[acetyl-CoA-carboxylase] ligase